MIIKKLYYIDHNDKLHGPDRRFFSRLFIFYTHRVSPNTCFKYDDISRRTYLPTVSRASVYVILLINARKSYQNVWVCGCAGVRVRAWQTLLPVGIYYYMDSYTSPLGAWFRPPDRKLKLNFKGRTRHAGPADHGGPNRANILHRRRTTNDHVRPDLYPPRSIQYHRNIYKRIPWNA